MLKKTKLIIGSKESQNISFKGCAGCGAKCCSSTLVYASLYDIQRVAKNFPIFFSLTDTSISLVLFFQYGKYSGQKCAYLSGELCSIYNERPYACISYPFSFDQTKNEFYVSTDCPHVVSNSTDGFLLQENGKVNKTIIDNFITKKMLQIAAENIEESREFVTFCHKMGILAPFLQIYPQFKDFQPEHIHKLYVIHPQRAAVVRMKYREKFNNEKFVNAIKLIISSMSNIEKLL